MGKIAAHQPPTSQTAAIHFSHPHPLSQCNNPPPQTQNNPSSCCSGCRLPLSGPVYSCTVCNYFLHEKCFKMPNKITHPCHKDHSFSLLPYPAYADGIFRCDACGENGEGFSYHCQPCSIDLHILCAVSPLKVFHPSHAHKLHLTFSVPYFNKEFSCAICKIRGSNHWLYRCESCGFDAHLKCATTAPIHRPHTHNHHHHHRPQPATPSFVPPPQPARPPLINNMAGVGVPQPATPSFVPPPQPAQPPVINNMAGVGVPLGNPTPLNIQMQQNEMILQMMQQSIQNSNAMVQSILSGSGGNAYAAMGGNNTYQQLMQSYSNLYANGGLGGSTGQEYIQALMNGGGGGFTGLNPSGGGAAVQDYYLQAMMNGGGGGFTGSNPLGGGAAVQDYYLQAMMNGGGGFTGLNPSGSGAAAQEYYLQEIMNAGGAGGGIPGFDALGGAGGGGLDFLCGAFGGFGL